METAIRAGYAVALAEAACTPRGPHPPRLHSASPTPSPELRAVSEYLRFYLD